VLADANHDRLRQILGQWVELLDRQREFGSQSIDTLPHNVVMTAGQLVAIDDEWSHARYSRSDVLERAALVCGQELALRSPRRRRLGPARRRKAQGAAPREPVNVGAGGTTSQAPVTPVASPTPTPPPEAPAQGATDAGAMPPTEP
jgi:hypothetical protein